MNVFNQFQAKFLTFLNMCLQFVFFAICILVDLTGQKSSLKKVKDVMFASAAFPIGVFVACIFWGLYAVDRELIFPVRCHLMGYIEAFSLSVIVRNEIRM